LTFSPVVEGKPWQTKKSKYGVGKIISDYLVGQSSTGL